ncbi:MAG: hypothetical protein AAF389_20420 [Gemmatimonadota bacterium]
MRHATAARGFALVVSGVVLSLPACTIAPSPGATTVAPADPTTLPPPGHGTLRQDDVTLTVVSRGLELKVTPLHESVTRVTAPDTYGRLSGIAGAHRADAPDDSRLFLVSFYSTEPNLRFSPEEVQLISRGLRMRPLSILPITPGWGQNRVEQRQAEMAVYAFGAEVDLESDLVLAYGFDETTTWSSLLTRIQAERGRARARAGGSSR